MTKDRTTATPAIRALRESGVPFVEHPYKYNDTDVAESAARELGLDEHVVIKTLVMEDDQRRPFLVLMHGDKQVSTKTLARALEAKAVNPCSSRDAQRHTGYMVGGISPFGTRKHLPIYCEESILSLPRIFINAGRRGLLVEITSAALAKVIKPIPVNVAR